MPKLPCVNHLDAIRAFEKVGFRILRQGRHVIMADGKRKLIIPQNNPVNAITMDCIVRNAGLTVDEFPKLL